MKIGVVGAGAIALASAAWLARAKQGGPAITVWSRDASPGVPSGVPSGVAAGSDVELITV